MERSKVITSPLYTFCCFSAFDFTSSSDGREVGGLSLQPLPSQRILPNQLSSKIIGRIHLSGPAHIPVPMWQHDLAGCRVQIVTDAHGHGRGTPIGLTSDSWVPAHLGGASCEVREVCVGEASVCDVRGHGAWDGVYVGGTVDHLQRVKVKGYSE